MAIILGIETSCDETAAAIMRDGEVLSNIISSQDVHGAYGGIVPELASRAHIQSIVPIIQAALASTSVSLNDLTHVAVTQGPGLIGSLLVGTNTAKAMACALGIPCLPVNHIEAHMFSPFLGDIQPSFPYLCLVVSGGHTLLSRVNGIGCYDFLGSTIDDAAGEAFDKVGKMLGLPFPGGPEIDRRARLGNPSAVPFPRPQIGSGDFRFSFSGLKTAVLYHVRKTYAAGDRGTWRIPESDLNDLCASFQQAVVDVLMDKSVSAMKRFNIRDMAIVGGVSANSLLKESSLDLVRTEGWRVFIPSSAYSTDNAAMVALLAHMKLLNEPDHGSEAFAAFARLPQSFFHAPA